MRGIMKIRFVQVGQGCTKLVLLAAPDDAKVDTEILLIFEVPLSILGGAEIRYVCIINLNYKWLGIIYLQLLLYYIC